MYTYKQIKKLALFFLFIFPHHMYPMDLALATEDVTFPIQTYPADLQCKIFESMLPHLNTYQTALFEDEQKKDTEEIQKIGVLRYQIACLVVEHLFKNSIKPKKIPNTMAVIQEILYRGILLIPCAKIKKMNEGEFLKNTLKYQQTTNIINVNIKIPDIISEALQKNLKALIEEEEKQLSIEAQFAYE